MSLSLRTPVPRRTFLRAGAVCIGLPFLDAMLPRNAAGSSANPTTPPQRLLLIGRNLGLHTPFLFPETTGLKYETTRYLRLLEEHRGAFTLFNGVSHLNYHSHQSESGLFTGVAWDRIKEPLRELRNSISLDQVAAHHLGGETRFPNLVIGATGGWNLSWSANGVPVPAERKHTEVFKQLFLNGTPGQIASEVRRMDSGKSILDSFTDESKAFARRLGADDKDRIERMFESIRDAEKSLTRSKAWVNTPKPDPHFPLPKADPSNDDLDARETLWYEIVRLAFETDSTRVILLKLGEAGRAKLEGLSLDHHDASHHGKDENKIEQLALIEEAELRHFSRFLTAMKSSTEKDSTLLERTSILFATNLSNASAHTSENLPIVVAGGGFAHKGYVSRDTQKNTPLSDLYLRVLQHLGIDAPAFGSSTGVLSDI